MIANSRSGRVVALAGAGFAALTLVTAARANSIGIDFSGAGTPVTTAAGVVAQTNWNNLSSPSGTITSGSVLDSTGATPAGLGASYGANGSVYNWTFGGNTFDGSDANQTGDTNLFSSSQNTIGDPPGSGYEGNISVSGIPYSSYDVYVYVEGDGGQVNLNGTPSAGSFSGGTTVAFSSASGNTDYVQIPVGGDGSASGNYIEFTGQIASSLILYDQQGSGGGLVGLQIVDTSGSSPVPEPASLSLLAIGAVGLLTRRRRSV